MTAAPSRRSTAQAVGLAVALLLTALAGLLLASPTAHAATLSVDQCNNVGPGPAGATTGMSCTVTVETPHSGGTTGSTTTVTRQCSLDPCPPANGSFTTSSTDLVTSVSQCNGSDNDAAHPISCSVSITNNISADTPGATLTTATVNQCVGSGGGGGGTVNCNPFPANTSGATVTQCNGSANGGGGTIDCALAPGSLVSPAIAISVNQCNGTGNPGGSVVTCRTSITTNLTAAPAPSASPTVSPTALPTASPTAVPLVVLPSPPPTVVSGQQVTQVPSGGVQAGGGSTSGIRHRALIGWGVLLLLAAGATLALRHRSGGPGRHRA